MTDTDRPSPADPAKLTREQLGQKLAAVRARRRDVIRARSQEGMLMVPNPHPQVAAEYEIALRKCDEEEQSLNRELDRRDAALPPAAPRWLTTAAFLVGLVLLVLLGALAFTNPTPGAFAWQIYKPLLALAGAAFSLGLLGFLRVRVSPAKSVVLKAGGPLAVFVVLFFWAAPPIPPEPNPRATDPASSTKPTLTPVQLHLLRRLHELQTQLAARKLIVLRDGQVANYGESAQPTDINLGKELGDPSPGPDHPSRTLVEAIEGMPEQYLRTFPETRLGSPFVVSVTDDGTRYLESTPK